MQGRGVGMVAYVGGGKRHASACQCVVERRIHPILDTVPGGGVPEALVLAKALAMP